MTDREALVKALAIEDKYDRRRVPRGESHQVLVDAARALLGEIEAADFVNRYQFNLVCRALGDLLIELGGTTAPLTGPELIMHADTVIRDLYSGRLRVVRSPR